MAVAIGINQISGEADNTPADIHAQMRALIVGGQAQLFRYSDATEQAAAALGAYDKSDDQTYMWPGQAANSVVDLTYVKLYLGTALLQYHQDRVGSGDTVAAVAGYTDRIRAGSTSFKSHVFQGVSYPRTVTFGDRDCSVGDIVDVAATVNGTAYALRTSIRGFVGEPVAATISAATASAGNAGTSTTDFQMAQTAGTYTGLHLLHDPTSTYNGLVAGVVRETYVISVIQASTGNNVTTGRLRVTSASGTDDQTSVQPSAVGVPFNVGTRGARVYLDYHWQASLSSDISEGIDINDLDVGQTWTLTLEQAYAAPTATKSGTYSGTNDTTYVVTVSRGGTFVAGNYPQISVSTNDGTDSALPVSVFAQNTPVTVGTKGVKIAFSGATYGMRAGDVYYIPAFAAGEGAMKTLLLNNNLPAALQNAADLELTLSIEQSDVLVSQQNSQVSGAYNYTADAAGVTVKAGLYLTDASLAIAGDLVAVPVTSGTLYVEYRAWLPGNTDQIRTVASDADLAAMAGDLHPDNPLKWGIAKAWANSNGTEVKYLAVANPTVTDDWQNAIDRITGKTGFHGVVPLTSDTAILDLFATHVGVQSDELVGRYRALWCCPAVPATVALLTQNTNASQLQAAIVADISAAGNPNILVQFATGVPNLQLLGLRNGDLLRVSYQTDAWGNTVYTEYSIAAVVSQDTLRLQAGPASPISAAQKVEIWRGRTRADIIAARVAQQQHFASTLVQVVWPDTAGDGAYTFAGYFVAAALAGLRSGVAPNRALTNVILSGITHIPRTDMLTDVQCQALTDAGGWVVQTTDAGEIVTRHGVTSAGVTDPLFQEEMVIANVHAIHGKYRQDLADMLGTYNVTLDTMDRIRLTLMGSIATLKQIRNASLGPQLLDASITNVARMTLIDHVAVAVTETVPVPFNQVVIQSELVA